VSPVKYELGFYIPEDGIILSHRRENLKYYIFGQCCFALPERIQKSEYRLRSCKVSATTYTIALNVLHFQIYDL
jgi:hypothetical protein